MINYIYLIHKSKNEQRDGKNKNSHYHDYCVNTKYSFEILSSQIEHLSKGNQQIKIEKTKSEFSKTIMARYKIIDYRDRQ